MSYFKGEEREELVMGTTEDIIVLFVCLYPHDVVFYF
jgi:hypothetical protein